MTDQIEATQAQPDVTETAPGLQQSAPKSGGVDATAETSPIIPKEEPTKKEELVSSKFAALAKKEKAIVKKTEEFKMKEGEFSKREQALNEREARIKESDTLFDTDVFEALKLRGYDYNKLTQLYLSGEKAAEKIPEDPATIATKTIEAFKKEMAAKEEAQKKSAEEAKTKAEKDEQERVDKAFAAYRTEVKKFVTDNTDTYELINLYGQEEMIVELVQSYFDQNQRVLSNKEAADQVEQYLFDEAEKATKTKKFSKAPAKVEEVAVTKSEVKTLNNNMSPTSASFLPAANESDRMKRAMQALNNQKA